MTRYLALFVALSILFVRDSVAQGSIVYLSNPADTCPLVDYTSLQDAINNASDGDTILVLQAPPVSPALLVGKSLTIVSAFGDKPQLGHISVEDLAPAQRVTLKGLTVSLRGDGCEGSIWAENVDFGIVSFFDCESVVLTRAGVATFASASSYPGILASNSVVHLFDSTVTTSKGNDGEWDEAGNPFGGEFDCLAAQPGGDALELEQSSMFVSGATIVCGDGGEYGLHPIDPFGGGRTSYGGGGHCVVTSDVLSRVTRLDTNCQAGLKGEEPLSPFLFSPMCGSDGVAGQDHVGTGIVADLPGQARSLSESAAGPWQEGTAQSLDLSGLPMDIAFLGFSIDQRATFNTTLNFASSLGATKLVFAGSLPTGSKSFNVVVPEFVSSGQALTFYAEAYFIGQDLNIFTSSPVAMTIVDSTYNLGACQPL